MRATGPLYPLVCALASVSALSLFETLSPTREDRDKAAPWLVAVGLVVGVAVAGIAVVGAQIAMAPAAGAAMAVVGLAVIFAGHREDRVAHMVTAASAGAAAVAAAIVLCRLALVWGIAASDWAAAFIASQIAGLWAGLLAARVAEFFAEKSAGDDAEASMPVRGVVVSGVAGAIMATITGGVAGLVGVLVASVFAVVAGYVAGREKRTLAVGHGGVQLVGELACLVVFAALASAEMSPWISY